MLSPEELGHRADLVVEGRIVAVRTGRLHGRSEDDPAANRSVVMVIRTEEIVKGQLPPGADGNVYVELPSPGGVAADAYDRAVPKDERVLLYLAPTTTDSASPIADPAAGRPAGQPLWEPYNPQGFLMTDGEGVVQPLGGRDFAQVTLHEFLPDSEAFPFDPNAPRESPP